MSSQYPKDEFDLAGEDMPVGMHRPQPSRWKNVIPFLVILVAVPVLGWGASQLLTSSSTVTAQSETPTVSEQAQSAPQADRSTEAPQSEPAHDPEPQSTPAVDTPQSEPQSQAAQINYNVAISVLNGTGTQGLAAGKAATLNEAGFAGTSAANADGWASEVSAVYYESPQVEASAREIARILGIETVAVNTTDLGNADVVVLLK